MAFHLAAPASYGVIVVLWAIILALLINTARLLVTTNATLKILVVVLAIDAFRTLFENLYFGLFFNSFFGVLPAAVRDALSSPSLLVLPKLVNIVAGGLVLFLIVRRWLPAFEADRLKLASNERAAAEGKFLKALKDERQKLLDAQSVAKVGSWDTDFITREVTWTPETFRIFDQDPATFAPTHDGFLSLVHPDDRAAVDAAFLDSWDTRDVCSIEHRICLSQGRVKNVVERWQTFLNLDGKRWRARGTCHDITEFKVAQQKAEAAEDLLKIAGHVAKLGGWHYPINGTHVIWSAETAEVHDESPTFSPTLDQAISYYIPDDRPRISAVVEKCMREGAPFNETLQIVTRTGRRAWVRAMGHAVHDETGKIVAIRGAFQDISELIEARENSKLVSERLYKTLDAITDGFISVDNEWRFTFVNRAARVLLQQPGIGWVGQNFWGAFPTLAGSNGEQNLRNVARDGRVTTFVEHYAPLNKWLSGRVYPSADGIAIYFQDITNMRAQQEQLALLETAVSRLNDIVMVTEADSLDEPGPRIVYVNDTFTKRTGYGRDEVLGRSPRFLQGPNTQRDALQRLRTALEAHLPVRAEVLNYTKTGQECWLELDITPIFDAAGRCTHFVSVERDVTERRAIQEALALSEQRFRLVTQATADTILDWDLAEGTVWWSEGAESQFGYNVDRTPAGVEAWISRIHPDDRQRVRDGVTDVISGEGTEWSGKYRLLRANGTTARIVHRASVIRDHEGKAIRVIGSVSDITAQLEMQDQLIQSQKMEAVGQLTGGIAHDFNNLLYVITANIDALREQKDLEDESVEYLDLIGKASERAADLIRRLLVFSRQQPLIPDHIDVNDMVVQIIKLLRRTLGQQITIESALSNESLGVNIDRPQFESALVNLCINARDAMPKGGQITIETKAAMLGYSHAANNPDAIPGNYVLVAVSDTGVGIPPEVVDKVFEPFFTTKGVGKGTGLGLSMVYGFIKQSNGHIKIDSELGKGTTVSIYLPRGDIRSSAEIGANPEIPGGHEKILVVEDDPQVRDLVVRQLQSLGYIATQASNAAEGITIFAGSHPSQDLILTDVIMPGSMNGKEMATEVLRRWPRTPVIFMSGYTDNAITPQELGSENIALLRKPFSKAHLAKAVRAALDRSVMR